ncbi:hypothetical protein HB904_09440 [Listeria booriae]|uniref:Uncharacterized protein n=1 Tax=Listeria booriae TaxID=1552123 RepID=A0A842AIQ7_9LIST|nr:hypothetical protein [Listeria booriae]MBC1616412.1 hypothetical protein [Listeria booriae]
MLMPENKASQKELIRQLLSPNTSRTKRNILRMQLKQLEDARTKHKPNLDLSYFLDEMQVRRDHIRYLTPELYAELLYIDFCQADIGKAFNCSRSTVQNFERSNRAKIKRATEQITNQEGSEADG